MKRYKNENSEAVMNLLLRHFLISCDSFIVVWLQSSYIHVETGHNICIIYQRKDKANGQILTLQKMTRSL